MVSSIPYVIALYMRLSMEGSRTDSQSIENQKLSLHRYVDSMVESMRDVQSAEVLEFIDDGYSGTNFERPSVQRLLDMVQAGKVNCIVVKDFTRFGRNSLEVGYYMERVFPLYGIRFIAVNDGFDTADLRGDTGGINVAFKYLMGEYYSRDLSIKSKSAKYVKMKRGEYQSEICPYGYRKSPDGRMEPDEETAPAVRLIFELTRQGLNTEQIASELSRRRIPTPGEYKAAKKQVRFDVSRTHGIWGRSTVLRILADERYTGTYIMGKRRVTEVGGHHVRMKDESEWFKIPDHHPAIISRELFEQASAKVRHIKYGKRTIHEYPLRGKVFCGCCHHALSRMDTPGHYYSCMHSRKNEAFPCYNLRITEKELEGILFSAISHRAQAILSEEAAYDSNCLETCRSQQGEYGIQVSECKSQKRALYESFVLQEISLEEYKERKAAIDRELERLQTIYASLSEESVRMQTDSEARSQRRNLAEEISKVETLTAALVGTLIERVYLNPDNQLEIMWKDKNFADM